MALVLCVLSLLAVILTVSGQWSCPDGWTGKADSPACGAATSASCSDSTCCETSAHFCSEYAVAWALSQALGAGCAADTKFFDLKKGATVVGGSQSEADIKAACCTASADATCADWTLKVCTGTDAYRKNAANAPGDDSLSISDTDFQDMCCAEKSTCAAHTCSAGTKKSNPSGEWSCSAGWTAKAFWPVCTGMTSASCSDASCCDNSATTTAAATATTTTCSEYAVVWALSQALGGGCAADTKFFDLKKGAAVVGGSQSEADIKAACCTASADATCADWTLKVCTGTNPYRIVAANAPGDNSLSISDTDFQDKCCGEKSTCESYTCSAGSKKSDASSIMCSGDAASCADAQCCDAPTMCSSYSVAWVLSQALGAGCAADDKFFDLKKATTTVGGSQSDADIKAACCTAFADATCADWSTVKSCVLGEVVDFTTAAPADGPATGTKTTLTNDKFRELCCNPPLKCTAPAIMCSGDAASCADAQCCDPPTTCSSYSVAWGLAQLAGEGCAADDKFFDLKKTTTVVGGSQSDADIKTACCTAFADATCADWSTVKSCVSGEYVDNAIAAPADGPATGTKTTLTGDKFKELCCKPPLKCAAYVAPTEAPTEVAAAFTLSIPLGVALASLMLTLTC